MTSSVVSCDLGTLFIVVSDFTYVNQNKSMHQKVCKGKVTLCFLWSVQFGTNSDLQE